MTRILPCTCKNKGQDDLHGPGRRVHNFGTKHKDWSCTVCGAKKVGGGEVKKK